MLPETRRICAKALNGIEENVLYGSDVRCGQSVNGRMKGERLFLRYGCGFGSERVLAV
jgi:hypothetical protein